MIGSKTLVVGGVDGTSRPLAAPPAEYYNLMTPMRRAKRITEDDELSGEVSLAVQQFDMLTAPFLCSLLRF